MPDPVSVIRNGHRTLFKWHRARRRAGDPVFTGRRILEGMALGASVEVDLVVHGERGFAVLHDHLSIARETTGTGAALSRTAAELRALHLRGNAGEPIADRVMLLEDLAALLRGRDIHPDALLQLDYKEDAAALDAAAIASFAHSVTPLGRHIILSSGDAKAVDLLTGAAPAIRVGYDPCHGDAIDRLAETRDFAGFVDTAVAASPRAETIYLAYEMVLAVADRGFDMIDAFHARDRRVDAYTIRSVEPAALAAVIRLLELGADQITTDDPEGLAAALSQ